MRTRMVWWGLGLAVLGSCTVVACGSSNDRAADGSFIGKGPQDSDVVPPAGNPGVGNGGTPSSIGMGGRTGSGGSTSAGGATAGPSLGYGGALSAVPAAGGAPSASNADAGAPAPIDTTPPIVNPFTVVAHDPLSTFAADVDTASYDLFSRSVSGGYLPVPSTVRTEEFVNYFSYAYPPPAQDAPDPFTISLSAAPGFFADGTTVLRVGIQGKLAPPTEKKPANLVFLVDTSGSMQSMDKLPLVQRVLRHTLDVLEPTDKVSIVRYAGDVSVALTPTAVSERTQIDRVITELAATGSTNGSAGINLAYDQAQAGFIEGGINHVLLCTDGDFNVGISDTTALLELIADKRKSGVTLTALGFGAAPNDAMMNAVSNAGNGIYSVITGETQADRYVEERMLSTLVHIAKDVKIQVEFNPEAVYAYRLLGYETRDIADNDFRNDIVDAGEIGAGHRVTALYHVVPVGHSVPSVTNGAPLDDGAAYSGAVEVKPADMVLVKVRYKQPDAHEADPAKEIATSLAITAAQDDLAKTDPDMQWAVAVGTFSEVLRGSPYVVPRAVLGPIGAVVDRTVGTDPDRVEFKTLFQKARVLVLGSGQ